MFGREVRREARREEKLEEKRSLKRREMSREQSDVEDGVVEGEERPAEGATGDRDTSGNQPVHVGDDDPNVSGYRDMAGN